MSEAELRERIAAFQVESRRILWAIEHEPGPGAYLQAAFDVMRVANDTLRRIAEDSRRLRTELLTP